MNQFTELFTTAAGGLALIAVAIVVRRKRPDWVGVQALLGLAGGVAAIQLVSLILSTVTGWLQWLLRQGGTQLGRIPGAGGALGGVIGGIGTALPWIVGLVLLAWFVIDMFPRVGALRRNGSGMTGMDGMAGGGGGGLGTRLSGLHSASQHTVWIAIMVPAAIALVTPLAQLIKIG